MWHFVEHEIFYFLQGHCLVLEPPLHEQTLPSIIHRTYNFEAAMKGIFGKLLVSRFTKPSGTVDNNIMESNDHH